MNNRNLIKRTVFKTGWIIILFVASLLFQKESIAQVKIKLNPVDSTKKDSSGILQKMVQPLKFKDNRDRRERERMYDYMSKLIEDKTLKIDTGTITQILAQLDTIKKVNASNEISIEGILQTFDIETKASKEVIETIKKQMSAVIQENAAISNQAKIDFEIEVDEYLKEIKKVQYSRGADKAALDSMEKDSIKYHIKRWLAPKMKIIGWHNAWLKADEYLRYNYNYLSAVNLFGYELGSNGKSVKPEYLADFKKPDGVIKKANVNGCEVYLTVYNKLPAVISKFLNDSSAQNILISELNPLILEYSLKGINIYFEGIYKKDARQLVQFIAKLNNYLNATDSKIQLLLTLPPVTSDASLTEISAYNFSELNGMVDFYQVLTDQIIAPNMTMAQPISPLKSSNKYQNRSVESTIGSYLNSGISPSKLIMSVSYLGIEWHVKDFSGTLKPKGQKNIKYADIVKNYPIGTVDDVTVTEGFDPEQAAPFLNVFVPNQNNLKQIWYEDSRSLYGKYIWAYENGLGGVAIKGLGYDDGYPELWDALGAALIKIDTLRVDSISLKLPKQEKKVRFPVLTYAFKGFSFKTFKQDLQWATFVRLKFDSIYIDTTGCKQTFYRVANIDSSEKVNSVKEYRTKEIIWSETTMIVEDSKRNGEAYLKNKSHYFSLYTRWRIYADFFKWGGIILALLTVISWLVSIHYERYSDKERSITRNLPSAFLLITLFFLSFWLYFDPRYTSFGAGSEDGSGSLIFLYSVIAGIVFGWFVTYRYYKYKGS